jgi:hypothetical protein
VGNSRGKQLLEDLAYAAAGASISCRLALVKRYSTSEKKVVEANRTIMTGSMLCLEFWPLVNMKDMAALQTRSTHTQTFMIQ